MILYIWNNYIYLCNFVINEFIINWEDLNDVYKILCVIKEVDLFKMIVKF